MGARHVTFSRIRNRFSPTPTHPLFLRTASRAPRTLAACLSGHRLSPATAPPIHADLTQSEAQGDADATFCPCHPPPPPPPPPCRSRLRQDVFLGEWGIQNELKPKISQTAESPSLLDSLLPSQLLLPPPLLLLLDRRSSVVNLFLTNREGLTWPTPRLQNVEMQMHKSSLVISNLLLSQWHRRRLNPLSLTHSPLSFLEGCLVSPSSIASRFEPRRGVTLRSAFPTIWGANRAQASSTNGESRVNDIRRVFSGPAVDSLACFFPPLPRNEDRNRIKTKLDV